MEIIEERAFNGCTSIKGPIKLLGVKIIKKDAFYYCKSMTDVEFGDKLETSDRAHFISARN